MATVHYVDNKKLFAELVKYKAKVARQTRTKPAIPEYIGECLLKIATRLSNKPNFASYSFKDDMISDAVVNCLLYLHNFDPEKSHNPFAYFTQIIHYAFIRRIEQEKKLVYGKYKYAMHVAHRGEDHSVAAGESYEISTPTWMGYENIHEFIRTFEEKLARPRPTKASLEDDREDDVTFDMVMSDMEITPEVDGLVEDRESEEDE